MILFTRFDSFKKLSIYAGDPYHAYYQYKVSEIAGGKPVPDATPEPGMKRHSTAANGLDTHQYCLCSVFVISWHFSFILTGFWTLNYCPNSTELVPYSDVYLRFYLQTLSGEWNVRNRNLSFIEWN